MSIISTLLGSLGSFCLGVIGKLGYFGVFILMTMESMIFPIPSELVMPFAGFLAATGEMGFAWIILFSSIGSLVGSLISYYIGYYGGNKAVLKFGKYLLLDEEDLAKTEHWFSKKGDATVFISRFIPVVRHLISIPAGIGKMDMKKFLIYTLVGATMWNAFLAYCGYALGQNWELVKQYNEMVSIPVAIILVVAGCYVVYRHVRHKLNKNRTS